MDPVRLTNEVRTNLILALTYAAEHGRSARIATGQDQHGNWIKWDIGNTGWTPPYYGVEW